MSATHRSDIVRSLLKYPLTADLLRVISQAWATPYKSRSRARSDLAAMVQDEYEVAASSRAERFVRSDFPVAVLVFVRRRSS